MADTAFPSGRTLAPPPAGVGTAGLVDHPTPEELLPLPKFTKPPAADSGSLSPRTCASL